MEAPNTLHDNLMNAVAGESAHFPESGTARRWAIWALQVRQGLEPCFATSVRFRCEKTDCPWWSECQDLQAEWRR